MNDDIFYLYYLFDLCKNWLKLKFLKVEKPSEKDWSCNILKCTWLVICLPQSIMACTSSQIFSLYTIQQWLSQEQTPEHPQITLELAQQGPKLFPIPMVFENGKQAGVTSGHESTLLWTMYHKEQMQVLKETESHGLLILEKYSHWKMTVEHHFQVSANIALFQSILYHIKLLQGNEYPKVSFIFWLSEMVIFQRIWCWISRCLIKDILLLWYCKVPLSYPVDSKKWGGSFG